MGWGQVHYLPDHPAGARPTKTGTGPLAGGDHASRRMKKGGEIPRPSISSGAIQLQTPFRYIPPLPGLSRLFLLSYYATVHHTPLKGSTQTVTD